MTEPQAVEILLVEDNPGDVRLTREAFRDARIHNNLHVIEDGAAAIEFLRGAGPYTEIPYPDLILLDLNLPKKNGREVLDELKRDPQLCHIPVIILTTSDSETDVLDAYELHANCYITKPVDPTRFIEVGRAIEDFWLEIVKLPQERH